MSQDTHAHTTQNTPVLQHGQILPAFSLPGADGMPHGPWDYKQREHLLLIFMQSAHAIEGRGLLRVFAQHYKEFREEDCALLVITAESVIANKEAQDALHLPFALLADPTGTVIARYTDWDATSATLKPCIVLADRYGAVYQQWIAAKEAELPPVDELLEVLRYLNRLCSL
jgi:peroxiredoxin